MLTSTQQDTIHRLTLLAFLPILILAMVGLSSTNAGELNPAHVPADAQWLVHVDYESLSDSAMWKKLRDEKPNVSQAVRGWMKSRYGIDPPKDLKSLTMFSRDYRQYTGSVVIQAEYEADKIEARLRKALNHRTTQWQEHTLHTITLSKQKPADDGPSGDQEMTVALVDEQTILLASSVPNAKDTLKLLTGNASSLKGKDSPLLDSETSNAWVYGAAINLGELKKHPVAMPIIAQHERINWSFGEQPDGTLYEHADLIAQSEEVAQKMKAVFDGIVAFETLAAAGSKPLSALMKNVNVTQNGKASGFHWEGGSDQVVAAMDDFFARMQTWKPMLMKDKGQHAKTKKR